MKRDYKSQKELDVVLVGDLKRLIDNELHCGSLGIFGILGHRRDNIDRALPLFLRIAKMRGERIHVSDDDQLIFIGCQRNVLHYVSFSLRVPARHACGAFKNPFLSSQLTCGPVYLQVTSPFSVWNDHGTTITVSPSRIHVLFFIFPRIRHILVTLSRHRTLKW